MELIIDYEVSGIDESLGKNKARGCSIMGTVI